MENKIKQNGILPIINQITADIKKLVNELQDTQNSVSDKESIYQQLIKHMNLLTQLGEKVEKTSILIQSVISSISSSRSELKKSVEGLLHKTSDQLDKITSTTEEATNKILDVAEELDDNQMDILQKLESIEKEFKIPSEKLDEIKTIIHSNQDKAFTIMDHLQFQDITAQQIAGAYALLSDTEKTLVYVSEVLREFDDLNKEEQLASNKTINGNSFNADAKFENKKDLQNSIDDLFSSGDLNTEFKQQDQTAEKNKHHISQDDIDKLTKQKKSPVSQDEIDKIANESQNQIKQNDIDDLFNN